MLASLKQKICHPTASSVEMADMEGPVEVVEQMVKKVVDSEVQGGGAD